MIERETIHACCVAIGDHGVLLIGQSGSGKSDLALRLIDRGAALVSDDYSNLSIKGKGLYASPPERIAGKIEVRGIGIIEMAHQMSARIGLAVYLGDAVTRMPDERREAKFLGVDIAATSISAHESSAPIKVELALKQAIESR